MSLSLSNLGNKNKDRTRVGRGNASGHGTFSSRGSKGQRSRSGGRGGLKLKGFKQNLLNFPKYKGNKSIKPKNQVVQLSQILEVFADGEKLTPTVLAEKGLVANANRSIKILLDNEAIKVGKKLEIFDILISASARAKLEEAGGKVVTASEAVESEEKESKKPIKK